VGNGCDDLQGKREPSFRVLLTGQVPGDLQFHGARSASLKEFPRTDIYPEDRERYLILTLHKDLKSRTTYAMNFEDIGSLEDLEIVSEDVIWQNFERLAGFIFEKNDFRVAVNTVKTLHKKRRQYDVIARKSDRTFLVECKKWAGSRYRLSALKRAVVQHKERTAFYENIMNEDAIPVIVMLVEEEVRVYEGVPLVPVRKLNSFIAELDNHAEGNSFSPYEEDLPLPDEIEDPFPDADG
jgi:hypothetical protein